MNDHILNAPQPTNDAGRTDEETLVADGRASLTPAQMVEQKLMTRLKASPVLLSQVQRRLKPGPR